MIITVMVLLFSTLSSSKLLREPEYTYYPQNTFTEKSQVNWSFVQTLQDNWGLDHFDNTMDQKYSYNYLGSNSIVYVVDSGIININNEFDDRILPGINFVETDNTNNTNDCNGHGTHVSSLIGSKTYGIAKQVKIVPVRIFDCQGGSITSTVIKAISWVVNNHKTNYKNYKAIINLSISGPYSDVLNTAINTASKNEGIIFVVASGNYGGDACNYSPSSAEKVISVGCSDQLNSICASTNQGSCVTLYSPGYEIKGLSIYNNKNTFMSGTSMSTGYVSGIVALILSENPNFTIDIIKSVLLTISIKGILSGLSNLPLANNYLALSYSNNYCLNFKKRHTCLRNKCNWNKKCS